MARTGIAVLRIKSDRDLESFRDRKAAGGSMLETRRLYVLPFKCKRNGGNSAERLKSNLD